MLLGCTFFIHTFLSQDTREIGNLFQKEIFVFCEVFRIFSFVHYHVMQDQGQVIDISFVCLIEVDKRGTISMAIVVLVSRSVLFSCNITGQCDTPHSHPEHTWHLLRLIV